MIFRIAIVLFFFASCKSKGKHTTEARQQMMDTDLAFSNMSKAEGMKKAFVEFIDSEGVLLRPNLMPIVAADAIDYLSQVNDSSFVLTWKPKSGMMAESGDLGFTYGLYDLKLRDTTLQGTYVSIWKKQPDGKWKFVLDTGNEGVGR